MPSYLILLGFIGIFLAIGAFWTWLIYYSRIRKLRRLAATRIGIDSFATFRSSFPEISEEHCRHVYTEVQDLICDGFPLRESDDLIHTLEVDLGALDFLFEELLGDMVVEAGNPYPPVTVGELVRRSWDRRLILSHGDHAQ